MRAATLSTLTAATALAVLAPLAPAAAGATAPNDALAETCRVADAADVASGAATATTVLRERLRRLGSLEVTGVRLTYANGARCDVVTVDGRLPFGHDMKGYDAELSERGTLAVAGTTRDETEHQGIGRSTRSSSPFHGFDDEVLGAVVYVPVESGTMPPLPGIPPEWQLQPYTFTHTSTTASLTLRLRKGVEKRFTVTPATRAAAARRLERDLALASTAADRRDARRTYRLALDGVRLVMKPFRASWSGELPG
ncbi:hypothetical protein [Nocardioides okcheonensis]|uniref:hypothetical protein n=1 Tax=Nocardioides okcheonensis TaxID=2894081 RepID=UPI001E45CE8E|nr:hypothetical protein [Nocardioides okcheonensis]UFN42879.1 hypothetical protein LN652_12490 [Nocardioides okcheonensis]